MITSDEVLGAIKEFPLGQKCKICGCDKLDFEVENVSGYKISMGQIFIEFDNGPIIDFYRAKKLVEKLEN